MEFVYKVSNKEIARRTKTYTTLIISFFIGTMLFCFKYIVLYFKLYIYIILFLVALVFCARLIIKKYFKSLLNTKVILNEENIIKNGTKYKIKNIKKIVIKKNVKGNIRAIKIILNDKIIYINNIMEDIEEFLKNLKKYLPKNVIEKNIKEPIDCDNLIFQVLFGLLLGILSAVSVKLFSNPNHKIVCCVYYTVAILSIVFGTYFITYNPICKRKENPKKIIDYIWGVIFTIGGILVLLTTIC